MFSGISAAGARLRLISSRILTRLGLREDSYLLILAFLIGIVTAAAAVGFHELINLIRYLLYTRVGPGRLYSGRGLALLMVLPALGGLAVGVFSRFVIREREGHGIIDVMESVMRTGGVIRPASAIEKIVTSAMTIGSGGSAGAEGPIVQIGAAIASGIGQLFRVARSHMPVLIGCGSAAGISAIFNSPLGGLLFTLEVILRDFSIRTITPLVIASVLANFTTQAILKAALHEKYVAIFNMPQASGAAGGYGLEHVGHFALLGIVCGVAGAAMTRLMYATERGFGALPMPRWLKPAVGGAILGAIGVAYVLIFGHLLLGRDKFIPFDQYSMPAFFGDGYGAVKPMLGDAFYQQIAWGWLFTILLFLCAAKIVGTCLTLGSGGAGGVIAPSLFLGAVAGGALGLLLGHVGLSPTLLPNSYALIGMGAVLAAVVHAPLASVLILVDVTGNNQVILPAMLATIAATGAARLISRDSIYTLSLRLRGIRVGTGADLTLLRRLTVEQVNLEPASIVKLHDPLQRVLDLVETTGESDFVVSDGNGSYIGMVVGEDIRTALLQREAIPLLTVAELMRANIPIVTISADLASVMDLFSTHDVPRLPVCVSKTSARIVGLISRAGLLRRYQSALADT